MTRSLPRTKWFVPFSMAIGLIFASTPTDRAHGSESRSDLWEPAKTWVFAVSLARFQGDRLHDFNPPERIDGDFETLFEHLQVPRDQIVFLKDEQGTTERVRTTFDRLLHRTRLGDFLFFYFGSHGGYNPRNNSYVFSTYDGQIPYDWCVDSIEASFRGSQALLTTDCCHSGGIIDVVNSHPHRRVAYACLSSMYSHSSGSNVWRFMRCLMRGLSGDSRYDSDGNGYIELKELALGTRQELSFLRETSPMYHCTEQFGPRFKLSKASGPRTQEIGQQVLVHPGENRRKAVTEAVNGKKTQVRFADNDQLGWVTNDHVQTFHAAPAQSKGARVWMRSTCTAGELWHLATVIESWETLHLCRPDDHSDAYDEWSGPSNLSLPMTGMWSGKWANSADETGDSQFVLKETHDGQLSGTWDGIPMEGERIGGLVFVLTGKTPGRSYRMIGRLIDDQFEARYIARAPDDGHYFGWLSAGRTESARNPITSREIPINGKWDGSYVNTKGQGGSETLNVKASSDGRLVGTWTDGVSLRGDRVGCDVIYLEGIWGGRSYQIVGLAQSDRLVLRYVAHGPNRDRYYGESQLRRAGSEH